MYRLPRDIDSRATITIGAQSFDIEATDLEPIETLGRGAYGVVERMRHRPSDTVMAVKVCKSKLFQLFKIISVIQYMCINFDRFMQNVSSGTISPG